MREKVSSEPLLQIRGLSRRFGEFTALNGVTLSIAEGATQAVIGPNGAGKTTLVNVITGLYPATHGNVVLDGREISRSSAFEIARMGLMRTFQITSLFLDLTVEENIEIAFVARRKYRLSSLGKRADSLSHSDDIIDLVGLGPVAAQKVENISHGDQRLLEVGVALAAGPHVLLLDEPTAGMSPSETERFVDLLNTRLKGAYTMLLIEHDMDVVMQTTDRITVLESGRVLADGTPDEIMANSMVQEAYLGRPQA
jgi:branched-chain amino acid transport system ATP-binding protein